MRHQFTIETMAIVERFGRYNLLSRIGYGGMAEVFLASTAGERGSERLLALKRLLPHATEEEQIITLLIDEARITVRLTHPNIVQVFDFGCIAGRYYIAMEYVDGLDVKSLISIDDHLSKPLDVHVALYIVGSVLEALHFAHTREDDQGKPLGIIHRDVTPHNVLLSRQGNVKLTDFGVARAAISSHVSQVGDIRGKFSYMPPEQACGGEIDQRVDLFAVGAMLYELLTGKQPFRAASAGEQFKRLIENVAPPMTLRPDLSPTINAVVLKALEKNPEQRFATAYEFYQELRACFDDRVSLASCKQQLADLVTKTLDDRQISTGETEIHTMSIDDYALTTDSLIADLSTRRSALHPLRDYLHAVQSTNVVSGIFKTLEEEQTVVSSQSFEEQELDVKTMRINRLSESHEMVSSPTIFIEPDLAQLARETELLQTTQRYGTEGRATALSRNALEMAETVSALGGISGLRSQPTDQRFYEAQTAIFQRQHDAHPDRAEAKSVRQIVEKPVFWLRDRARAHPRYAIAVVAIVFLFFASLLWRVL